MIEGFGIEGGGGRRGGGQRSQSLHFILRLSTGFNVKLGGFRV